MRTITSRHVYMGPRRFYSLKSASRAFQVPDSKVQTFLYHPNRHDQIVSVKGAEMIRHTEDRAGAELKRALVDHPENTGQALVGRGGFLDLQRTELAIAFEDHVDLLGVAVAVEIEIWFQPNVLIALHDLRHGEVFEQRTVHRTTFGDFRGRPAGQVADEPGVVEIHLRRLDRALKDVIRVGMK